MSDHQAGELSGSYVPSTAADSSLGGSVKQATIFVAEERVPDCTGMGPSHQRAGLSLDLDGSLKWRDRIPAAQQQIEIEAD